MARIGIHARCPAVAHGSKRLCRGNQKPGTFATLILPSLAHVLNFVGMPAPQRRSRVREDEERSMDVRKLTLTLTLAAAAILTIITAPANADLLVRFEEAAPKDRFVVTNDTGCTFARGVLVISLEPSPRGLLFDTVRGGAGENVAQPLEIAVAENVDVVTAPVVDGAHSAKVAFNGFPPEGRLVITVDVDDSDRSGPLGVQMISNSEMAGALVRVVLEGGVAGAAVFNAEGEARVAAPGCRFD